MISRYLYFLAHNVRCRFLGRRSPLLAGFKLTHRCNLHCAACPFWRRPQVDISYDAACLSLDRLHAAGARLVIFEGGEPFLWRDGSRTVEDLVEACRGRFFSVGITTNGTLPFETQADVVWVSIDGPRAVHDAYRSGSYDRILANIAASGHRHVLAQVTVSRLNWQQLPLLVDELAGVVRGITFQLAYPYGDADDISLAPDERRQVLDDMVALKRRGYPILDSYGVLNRLKDNSWRCHDWLIANAEPDGSINLGCYLRNREQIRCDKCGFAAHAELSRAYDWDPEAILCGTRVFRF